MAGMQKKKTSKQAETAGGQTNKHHPNKYKEICSMIRDPKIISTRLHPQMFLPMKFSRDTKGEFIGQVKYVAAENAKAFNELYRLMAKLDKNKEKGFRFDAYDALFFAINYADAVSGALVDRLKIINKAYSALPKPDFLHALETCAGRDNFTLLELALAGSGKHQVKKASHKN